MKTFIMVVGLLFATTVMAGQKTVAVAKSNAKASINTHNVNSHNTTNTNTNEAKGGDANAQGGNATAGAVAAGGDGGNASNGGQTVVTQAKDIPVGTAYSASLTSGLDTCMGSGSAGVQTMVVGITGGKTYRDSHCEMVKDTQLLREMHLDSAACFRARAGDEGKAIDVAMKSAGVDCNTYGKPVEAPVVVVEPVAPVDAVTHQELREVEDRIITRAVTK